MQYEMKLKSNLFRVRLYESPLSEVHGVQPGLPAPQRSGSVWKIYSLLSELRTSLSPLLDGWQLQA